MDQIFIFQQSARRDVWALADELSINECTVERLAISNKHERRMPEIVVDYDRIDLCMIPRDSWV